MDDSRPRCERAMREAPGERPADRAESPHNSDAHHALYLSRVVEVLQRALSPPGHGRVHFACLAHLVWAFWATMLWTVCSARAAALVRLPLPCERVWPAR